MRATAASAPSKTMFSVSCDVDPGVAQLREHVGEHAGLVPVPHDQQCVAGVWRARLTTFGHPPGLLVGLTMRTVSAAIASCAWSVDAPMWCVP